MMGVGCVIMDRCVLSIFTASWVCLLAIKSALMQEIFNDENTFSDELVQNTTLSVTTFASNAIILLHLSHDAGEIFIFFVFRVSIL